jgi:uncharacterized protein (TIGR02147 family)
MSLETPHSTADVDVLHYECPRNFLKEAIEARRKRRANCGLRQLAKKASIPSASLLSLIIGGQRRLTEASATKIADALNLRGRRKHYFILLGKLSSAKSEEEKLSLRDQLIRIRSAVDSKLLEAKQYRFLADWFYTVIYVMVGLKNFVADSEWISTKLKKKVEPPEVKTALADLETLGLIRHDGKRWIQSYKAVSTSDDLKESALFLYHSQMIQKARDALELHPNAREFNGVTITIPRNQLPEVKKRIREFRKSLNEYLSQFSEPADVFQINLQLFPLTEGLEET